MTKIKFEYRITAAYLIIGAIWILFSDKILSAIIHDNDTLTEFQSYKGIFYVITTGVLFYFFIRKHLEKLRNAEQKAITNDRLKTAFIQNISHEIRTPMNGIIGFTGLLNDENLTKKQKKQYIDIITGSSDQLLKIINEVMDISLIESGNITVNESVVNLNKLLDDVKLSFQSAINNGNRLSVDKGLPDNESIIATDVLKLRQILSNLIGNANKFTDKGHIKLSYLLKDKELEFSVEDNGIGIQPEVQTMIFDRFFQADSGSKRVYNGVGLGLSICKGNVDILKGRIWVKSELNTGSEFHFTIPYKPANPIEAESPPKHEKTRNLNSKSILVAEDEESNFYYIKELFEGTGANLYLAVNGNVAVKFCRENPELDLILMDIKMPGVDGYKATKQIREFNPDIPIIAQTAFAMREERETALSAGCNDYISKPFKKEQLISLVCSYIR